MKQRGPKGTRYFIFSIIHSLDANAHLRDFKWETKTLIIIRGH